MKDGSLKYIIIIIIALVTIGVLSFYIMDTEKQLQEAEKSTNTKIVKEKKDKIVKNYLFTRKISLREGENVYNINLKYYGETLTNNKKVISTEVYYNDIIKGEYLYIAPIDSKLDYKEIINNYEKKEIDKKSELYLINNYLVLSLFRYEDNINNTLVIFDKEGEKLDEFNHKYIKECTASSINERNLKDVVYQADEFVYFEKNDKEINDYTLSIGADGFIKNKVGSYSYEEQCK